MAYVVVILNAPSWLSASTVTGYKPACSQQAPLWGGALKAGLQRSREEEGGAWELCSFKFSKSTFFSFLELLHISFLGFTGIDDICLDILKCHQKHLLNARFKDKIDNRLTCITTALLIEAETLYLFLQPVKSSQPTSYGLD